MMKKITLLLLILISFICLFSSSCHVHIYQQVESLKGTITAPTCTTYGVYKSICSCGKLGNTTFTGKTLADHTLTTIDETEDEVAGLVTIKHQHCSVCNQDFDESGNVLTSITKPIEHVFSEYHDEVPVTCLESGTKGYYYCSHCDKYFDQDYQLITDLTINPLGHSYGEYIQLGGKHQRICQNDSNHVEEELCTFSDWNVVKEATAFTKGLRTCTCLYCGYVKEEEIKELHIHEFSSEWTIDIEPTCEVAGKKSHHCLTDGCLEVEDETIIPALDHSYSEWEDIVKVTCTTNGERSRTCTLCGKVEKEEVVCIGHQYSSTITLPTCLEQGYTTYQCLNCEDNYIGDYVNALGHDLVSHEKVNPTCTTVGHEKYDTCSRCTYTTYVEIPLIDHDYSVQSPAIDHLKAKATCTSKALYYVSCSMCHKNSTNTFEYGELLEHKYVENTDIKYLKDQATCTSLACYYQSCQVCGTASTTLTFEKAGSMLEHTYIEEAANSYLKSSATCTSPAVYYKSCKDCHHISSETFEVGQALGHDFQNIVKADYLKQEASCTSKAVYYQSCLVCKTKGEETFETGDLLTHTYIKAEGADYLLRSATCTTPATYYESCEVCHALSTTTFEVGIPLGHNILHQAGAIATVTSNGYHTYEYCTRCSYTTKVEIPYSTHNFVEIINQTTSSDNIKYRVEKCTTCEAFKVYDELGNNISDNLVKYSSLEAYHNLSDETKQKNYLAVVGKLLRVQVSSIDFTGSGEINCSLYAPFSNYHETESIFSAVDSDWPIFFWRTSNISSSQNALRVYVDSAYQQASIRQQAWLDCVNGLNTLITNASNNSLYPTEISKIEYVYNTIISNIDYAYLSDNVTPDSSAQAHSIHGYFSGYNCVCEGYSKTLQLVLNQLGIITYYITGTVDGSGHAWNYVTLDNEVYFCDITWDDQTNPTYEYFLRGQSFVSSMSERVTSSNTFGSGIEYNAVLPTLSTSDYNLVTLYTNNTISGKYHSLEDAYQQMTNAKSDYQLYLYDLEEGVFRNNLTIDLGLIPSTLNSLTLIGKVENSVYQTNLILISSSNIQTNIIIEDVHFPQTSIFTTPNLYQTFNLNNYNLTFNRCYGYMSYNINSTGNVYINNSLTGSNSNYWHCMSGSINCNTLEINNSEFYMMGNLNVTNLNLNGILNFIQPWSFTIISNVNITNLYPLSTNSYISLQASIVNNIINFNVTNIIGTNKLRIDTYFSSSDQMPYITITGNVNTTIQICLCGKVNGSYLNKNSGYPNPLFTVTQNTSWNYINLYTISNGSLAASKNDVNYDTETGQVTFK